MMRYVTIAARNYVPGAAVLGASLAHHEGAELTVVVVDALAGEVLEHPALRLIGAPELPIPSGELERMATIYSVTELSTALKPFALQFLLDEGASAACYLDPDMCLYAPLEGLAGMVAAAQVVLTPHVLHPLPRDGKETSEYTLRRCGIFNMGFVAVSAAGRPFVDFLGERVLRDAISDAAEMLYTDQKWADWAPALFDTAIWRDPGVNVAYWNLHEREPVGTLQRGISCGGQPLRLFHFSGFDATAPERFSSRPGSRYRVDPLPDAVVTVASDYAERMVAAGAIDAANTPYGYARTPRGYPLQVPLRRRLRAALLDAERTGGPLPPSAFDDEAAFFEYLVCPEPCGAGQIPRVLSWSASAKLGIEPPQLGEDSYLQWLISADGAQAVLALRSWAEAMGRPVPQTSPPTVASDDGPAVAGTERQPPAPSAQARGRRFQRWRRPPWVLARAAMRRMRRAARRH